MMNEGRLTTAAESAELRALTEDESRKAYVGGITHYHAEQMRRWDGYPLRDLLWDAAGRPGEPAADPGALRSLYIVTNGLAGETGETLEHFKKWIRDGKLDRREVAEELGDVLAYLTFLTGALGYTLDDIAEININKLRARDHERRQTDND